MAWVKITEENEHLLKGFKLNKKAIEDSIETTVIPQLLEMGIFDPSDVVSPNSKERVTAPLRLPAQRKLDNWAVNGK